MSIKTLEAKAMTSSKRSQSSSSKQGKVNVDDYVHDVWDLKILQTGNRANRYFDFKVQEREETKV